MSELDLFASAGDGLDPTHFGIADDGRAFVEAPAYAKALQYSSTQKALQIVDPDEWGYSERLTPGGVQRMKVIYEDGIWELIFRSTLPSAKSLKARVKSILRQLRETGVVDTREKPMTELEMAERYVATLKRVAELEPMAEGYRHFIETDGTVKWANACDHLGVAPNLFGALLREQKVTYTDTYTVERKGKTENRPGEQHNRPYSKYRHWFDFPAYSASERLAAVPGHKQFDRRVTKAGMDGLLRLLKRHVVGCGDCSLCKSVEQSKPEIYASWRPRPQLGPAA